MGKYERMAPKKANYLIALLMFVTLISASLSVYLLCCYETEKPIMPDYMPVEQDKHVVSIPVRPSNEIMDIPENGGGAIIICDTTIKAHLDNEKIDISYENPIDSASAVVLQLWVGDVLAAQSGSIYPGYQLNEMNLLAKDLLQEGGYNAILKVAFYDPDSGEKALVDTDIEVSFVVEP